MDTKQKILLAITIIISLAIIGIFIWLIVKLVKSKKHKEKFEQGHIISNFNTNLMEPLNFNFDEYEKKGNENEILMKNHYNASQDRIYNDDDYNRVLNKAIMENNEKLNYDKRQLNAVMLARANEAVPKSEDFATPMPKDLEKKIEDAATEQFMASNIKYDPVGTGVKYSNMVHDMYLDSKDLTGQKTYNISMGDYTGITPIFKDGIDPVSNIKSVGTYGFLAAGTPEFNNWPTQNSVGFNDFAGRTPINKFY